ncbi:hypothetical protein TNCV_2489401 [Trichonephila clavipes]|nr:hypothetical protein TNCV_2489401 [Trichonephila clavipes]
MALVDWYRTIFAYKTIYQPSAAVVFLRQPTPTFLKAVPVVWNAFQSRDMTRLLILNFSATLTDHLIGTSAHAPHFPMVTYTEMGKVGIGPHGLLRH